MTRMNESAPRILRRSRAASAAALLALAVSASALQGQDAPVRLPDTGPGRALSSFLDVCASPDQGAFERWEREHAPRSLLEKPGAAALAESDARECSRSGGFEARSIETSGPDRMEILAVTRKGGAWTRMALAVGEEGRIAGFRLEPAMPPESSLPADLDDAALRRHLQERVSVLAAAGLFSGIVEVSRNGQVIARATGGSADRDEGTPITGSTRFTIGSMGKMFTAVAVGQLVDRGQISFSDTVGRFFPHYPNETVRREVTVGMLLSHTAGMGDFLSRRTPEMMKHGVQEASEFLPLFENDSLKFEPGTDWSYSNAGLALAGAIVEGVSGQPYPEYLREHVFGPAGMEGSDPNNVPHRDPKLVTPYTHRSTGDGGGLREAEHDIGSPAGGAISTADDLVRFAHALRSGALVSRATFRRMSRPHGHPGHAEGMDAYGYAMMIGHVYGRTVVGHGGGFPGVNTRLDLVLGTPYTVVVLSNFDPPAAEIVRDFAVPLVVEKVERGRGPDSGS